MAADSLKSLGESFAKFQKNWGVGPNILQRICGSMPKDKIRNCLADAAKSIRAVRQDTEDPKNPTCTTTISICTKHFTKWSKGHWVTVINAHICFSRKSILHPPSQFDKLLNVQGLARLV